MHLNILAGLAVFGVVSTALAEEKPPPGQVQICLQTIREISGGNPPESAIRRCKSGYLDAAIEKAMSGG